MNEFENPNLNENEETIQEEILNEEPIQEEYEQEETEENFTADLNPYKNLEEIKYSPIKKQPVSSGVKAFALIMAFIFTATIFCTVGYVFGSNKKPSLNFGNTVLDLEERPSGEVYTTSQVYDIVNKSVVGIAVYNDAGDGAVASGVIYTEDGYIITNDHIYEKIPGAKFKVRTYDGKIYDAVFVAGDTRSDLAVLKIDANGFFPATFGNSDQIVLGESVVAIGRPNGLEENSITKGIISLRERRISINTSYSMRLIQTDAPINPGNSGGVLVNMYGQVIGITSSKISSTDYEGIGFAIPTTVAKGIVESLIKNGNVNNRSRLGITYKEIDSITKDINKFAVTGIMIAEVDQSSGLYGKVKVGDIITAVNGQEITNDDVILNKIESTPPQTELEFTLYSENGSYYKVKAKLLADAGSSSYVK